VNEIRVNELIDCFFNCDLGSDDRAALERALLRSPQARDLFWRKAEIHEGLREWGCEHWDRLGGLAASGRRPTPVMTQFMALGRVLRSATIPLTLIVGSLVGMGVAWAVVPQVRAALVIPLRITNSGFEDEPAGAIAPNENVDRLERLPTHAGIWGGDRVRVCGAEQGVVPVEGRRMLAFEKALPGPGDQNVTKADSCDLFQIVDLGVHRQQIAQGGCSLVASAQVIDAGSVRPVGTDFIIRVHVFGGDLESVLSGWPQTQLEAIATGTERVSSFGGQAAWRQLTAQSSLPKDATFAILQVDATNMDRTPGRSPATFDRHYCDDVRITLTVPPDQATGR
jgi:hypothetical protein